MSPGIWQILIIAALLLLFFGRGRISELMGDLGKGITSFKKGLSEDEEKAAREKRSLPPQGQAPQRPIDVTPEPAARDTAAGAERPVDVTPEPAPRATPPGDDQPRG